MRRPRLAQRSIPATIRSAWHGIFTEQGATTAFFLEYDTGTESLGRLVDKVGGYHALARVTGRLWPVLIWLRSAARERHLHEPCDAWIGDANAEQKRCFERWT